MITMQLILIQVEMPDPVLSERVLVEYDSACTMADAIEAYDPFQAGPNEHAHVHLMDAMMLIEIYNTGGLWNRPANPYIA